MTRKLLLIGIALALVLTTLVSVTALAAKPVPFSATGGISSITPGDVMPAGQSGRWRVIEREIAGSLSGDINSAFTMSYKANVELATQAGNLNGTLKAGSYVFKVNGKIQPVEFVGWYAPGIPLYRLAISGQWTFTDGAKGQGDFNGVIIFVPTPDGHVAFIADSSFTMTGQWQP